MNEDKYRISFNKLAMNTFGLDFEDWYKKDLFYHRYSCFSYINEDEVIANVSTNKMELVVEGEKKRALQIGTVMTHPGHRNKGLAASLMKHIIERYEDEYDIIYLFANNSVLDFYPRFGFNKVVEGAYELDVEQLQKKEGITKKLKTDNEEDYKTILRLGTNRQPISEGLGVYNDTWPLLVYCFYEYKEDLFYLADEDVIVITRREAGRLHIYDVLSSKPIDLDSIVETIVMPQDRITEFHFVPELRKYKVSKAFKERQEDTLFVRSNNTLFNEVLFPMTSHT